MKHRIRNTGLVIMAVVMALALSGCRGTEQRPVETPVVTMPPIATMEPAATIAPLATDSAAGATQQPQNGNVVPNLVNPFDWKNQAQSVQENVNRLSEISKSYIVVEGTTALVGVEFTSQYKGELTKRIRDMVAQQVQNADKNIRTVAVTADPGNVTTIRDIADRYQAGEDLKQFQSQIDSIVNSGSTIK